MTPLLLLAEKVEGLREGGSFAVDTEIAYALDLPLEGIAKAYTASVDAALSLVPENADSAGERFRLEAYNSPGVLAPHVRASAWVAGAARVYAATPALALVASALRARAAMEAGE